MDTDSIRKKFRVIGLGVLTAFCWAIFSVVAIADESEKPPPLMSQKLTQVQDLVAGLVTNNLKLVEDSADVLYRISKLDQWMKYGDEDYRQMTKSFQTAVGSISLQAKDGNLEGAALYYNQASITCIQCHNLMRDRE